MPKSVAFTPLGICLYSAVHPVLRHIVVYLLTMLLFLFLYMVQDISYIRIFKLKNGGIINGRHMLFSGQQIGAKIAVLLLALV